WMTGHIELERLNFSKAEKLFRQALPYFEGDSTSTGHVLFYLGWAEYNLGHWEEAGKAYERCAALGGSLQVQAARNLVIVKGQQRAQLNGPDLTGAAPALLNQGLVALGAGAAQKFF